MNDGKPRPAAPKADPGTVRPGEVGAAFASGQPESLLASQRQPGESEVTEHDAEYYIPATTSLWENQPRILKEGDTFAVFNHYGDVIDTPGGHEGLFHEDTRHLSHFALTFYGHRPLLLSSTVQDDNAGLTVDLANPDLYRDGRIALSRETLHITRTKFLWRATCYERIAIHNFDAEPRRIRLALSFAADFRDLFELRGQERARRGTLAIERPGPATVLMRYDGLDGLRRTTRLDLDPAPTSLSDREALFDLTLGPEARTSLLITIRCDSEAPIARGEFLTSLRSSRRALHEATSRAVVVDTSNTILNQILCRSVADLYQLMTDTPQGPYPYAGIPWFSTAFGRDGIITALQMLWFDPRVARGVLRFLAARQAREYDPARAAEPGKILHEMRHGEMARLGEVPFGLYYGTVDATPLFVLLAGRYFERTGDRATIEALWPHIEAALAWIDGDGDPDRDGFVEYRALDGKGLTNQGWKDSVDAISHADGRLAGGAIALVEVQAYVYAAKLGAARMCRALGKPERAGRLEDEAQLLRERFEAAFWREDIATYALALDGEKEPCAVRSSNAGHALLGGIASPARAARVTATLLERESWSGWGVRTLAKGESRYNPMSYHNGSVWPHDNSLIALGFARYGFKNEAMLLFNGLFEATRYMDQGRPPELFCGFRRRTGRGPTLYPVACSPQAWASATPLALLEAMLGLVCDHARQEIRFERPILPASIDWVRLRGLRLGPGRVDLILSRHENDVAVNVLKREGDLRVVVVN